MFRKINDNSNSNKMIGPNPMVCIIMPVYNGEKTIKYALASLVRQTYDNWECIIVNDGSTDGTKAILDSLNDNRFKVYHLYRNSGRGVAREEALRHAQGKYLCYLDADDMLHKDKIRVQVEYLESHPNVQLVSCGCVRIRGDMSPIGVSNCRSMQLTAHRYGDPMHLILPSSMVRLEEAMSFSYNSYLDVGEDYDYFSRYCDGGSICSLPFPYYFYMTGNVTRKKLFYYQWNSLRVGVSMIQNKAVFKGMKYIVVRLAKILAYSIIVPLCGTKYVINEKRYKNQDNMEWINDYDNEFEMIKQVACTHMGG